MNKPTNSLINFKDIPKDERPKNLEEFREFWKKHTKDLLEFFLEEEMNEFLGYDKNEHEKYLRENHRNGHYKKNVRSNSGEINLDIPRDRNGEFEPQIVPKFKYDISDFENQVIVLYSKGLSTRDIASTMQQMYGVELDASFISRITEKLIPKIVEWQNRKLDSIYPMIFIDGIRFKVKEENQIVNKSVYIVMGYSLDGIKEVLGFWIGESESAKYWMSVLNDIKMRGVDEIYIVSCDNLKGVSNAIQSVYPKAQIQKCIVHQIRNSTKFVNYKDLKEFSKDMKNIYESVSLDQALHFLDIFEQKWKNKYFYAVKSWRENLEELTTFFNYPTEIRKLIYTTNVIENLNRNIRKITKTKGAFPTIDSLSKVVYLAITEQTKKWEKMTRNWGQILNQILILFEK